jgi:hypothetical protein
MVGSMLDAASKYAWAIGICGTEEAAAEAKGAAEGRRGFMRAASSLGSNWKDGFGLSPLLRQYVTTKSRSWLGERLAGY